MLPQGENRPHDADYQMAAFIVGCLMRENLIPVIQKDQIDTQAFETAIRITAACLRSHSEPGSDYIPLPFRW